MALSITKPTVGGSEDTWGTTINTALDAIVDEVNDNADGTNAITPNLTQGSWKVGGTAITATAADINTSSTHYVPTGGIIMWSGSIASIPSGWYLCDGTNSTPDLRNRFVVGAGDEYAVDATGGAKQVTLTSAQIPSHTHSFSGTTGNTSGLTGSFIGQDDNSSSYRLRIHSATGVFSTTNYGPGAFISSEVKAQSVTHPGQVNFNGNSHTHSFSGTTGSTGSGSSHENRPPYYALAYIMKG